MSESYPYNGRLSRWEEIAEGLAIVGVEALESPFPFDPGQYATLGLMGPEGKLVQRPMSISSSSDRPVRVRVLHPPGGGWRLHPAAVGADAGRPDQHQGRRRASSCCRTTANTCFWVATGTGLAPFMSMLDTLRDRRPDSGTSCCCTASATTTTWPGAASCRTWPTDGEFPLRYAATVSRPQLCPDWAGLTGRAEAVIEEQMDEHGLTPDNTTLYLCGNPEMVSAVDEIATARGFPAEQVRKELYWPKGRTH